DLGIRAGALADSTLIARLLGAVSWFFVATAAYLKKRGRPKSPQELAHHDCLLFGAGSNTVTLRLEKNGTPVQAAVHARALVSDFGIVYGMAIAGLGIALLPAFRCVEDLRAHRLERVLREWEAPATPIHLIYPSTRHLSPKVKAFIDHLQGHMMPPAWELGP